MVILGSRPFQLTISTHFTHYQRNCSIFGKTLTWFPQKLVNTTHLLFAVSYYLIKPQLSQPVQSWYLKKSWKSTYLNVILFFIFASCHPLSQVSQVFNQHSNFLLMHIYLDSFGNNQWAINLSATAELTWSTTKGTTHTQVIIDLASSG